MSPGQYARFLVVGAVVGIVTVAAREVIGHLLATDDPRNYSLSVVLAYALGICLSFLINRRFTFAAGDATHGASKFPVFAAVAIVGLLVSWGLSLAFRYGLDLDARIGEWAKPAAFVAAVLVTSLLTYPLNAVLVFGGRARGAPATGS